MSQETFIFDSQMLNTFQACARKYQYNFIDNVHPVTKAEALEAGSLMHNMLEIYYSLQLDEPNFQTEFWKVLLEAGFKVPEKRDFITIQQYSIEIGRFHATKLDLPMEEIEETIFQFREYTTHFEHDSWKPLAVEEVGTKVLYEDSDLKLIYSFKIDLVAEMGNIIAPWDHKTARRRQEPSSLSNQFIGYLFGLGLNNIVINKIGFQKTLSPAQRFNRFILTVDDARIEEWRKNTVYWALQMIRAIDSGQFPMNLTSCDKYSGCIFSRLCETDPESRLFKIERDYKIGESWDVSKHLEEKNA